VKKKLATTQQRSTE